MARGAASQLVLCLVGAMALVMPQMWISTTAGSIGDSINLNQKNIIHEILHQTFGAAKSIIDRNASNDDRHTSTDPLYLDGMWMIFKEENGFLNASLSKIKLRGLPGMVIKDIASNLYNKRMSVLLNFPEIKTIGMYRVKGVIRKPEREILADQGRFQVTIKDLGASWSAKLLSTISPDMLQVTQMAVTSHHNHGMTSQFQSYSMKRPTNKTQEILDTIAASLAEKVNGIVEEKMMEIMSQLVNVTHVPTERPKHLVHEFRNQYRKHPIAKRQIPCENGEELDEYVDSLFRFASRFIRSMEPIALPNATVEVWDYNLVLFFHSGGASRTYNLERKKPAKVHCTNNTISVAMTIQFEDIRINYKYRAIQDWRLLFNGDADISVKGTKLQIQLTQTTEGDDTRQHLDRLRVWRLGNIRVILRGLGNLTSALSMLITQMINENQALIVQTLEERAPPIINQMFLANLTIPLFSLI